MSISILSISWHVRLRHFHFRSQIVWTKRCRFQNVLFFQIFSKIKFFFSTIFFQISFISIISFKLIVVNRTQQFFSIFFNLFQTQIQKKKFSKLRFSIFLIIIKQISLKWILKTRLRKRLQKNWISNFRFSKKLDDEKLFDDKNIKNKFVQTFIEKLNIEFFANCNVTKKNWRFQWFFHITFSFLLKIKFFRIDLYFIVWIRFIVKTLYIYVKTSKLLFFCIERKSFLLSLIRQCFFL